MKYEEHVQHYAEIVTHINIKDELFTKNQSQ
jgi:hypothetical protein